LKETLAFLYDMIDIRNNLVDFSIWTLCVLYVCGRENYVNMKYCYRKLIFLFEFVLLLGQWIMVLKNVYFFG
jgi:hypothetical protein